jgi:hypothetical protein
MQLTDVHLGGIEAKFVVKCPSLLSPQNSPAGDQNKVTSQAAYSLREGKIVKCSGKLLHRTKMASGNSIETAHLWSDFAAGMSFLLVQKWPALTVGKKLP